LYRKGNICHIRRFLSKNNRPQARAAQSQLFSPAGVYLAIASEPGVGAFPGSRMKQQIGKAISIGLMLVIAALSVLCVRSYFRLDDARIHTAAGNRYGAVSSRGSLLFEYYSNEASCAEPLPARGLEVKSSADHLEDYRHVIWSGKRQWRLWGYGLIVRGGTVKPPARSARAGGWQSTIVLLPDWACVLLMCVCLFVSVRQNRGVSIAGLCRHCGYDLRATPGRCPECGRFAAGPAIPGTTVGQIHAGCAARIATRGRFAVKRSSGR